MQWADKGQQANKETRFGVFKQLYLVKVESFEVCNIPASKIQQLKHYLTVYFVASRVSSSLDVVHVFKLIASCIVCMFSLAKLPQIHVGWRLYMFLKIIVVRSPLESRYLIMSIMQWADKSHVKGYCQLDRRLLTFRNLSTSFQLLF